MRIRGLIYRSNTKETKEIKRRREREKENQLYIQPLVSLVRGVPGSARKDGTYVRIRPVRTGVRTKDVLSHPSFLKQKLALKLPGYSQALKPRIEHLPTKRVLS